MTYSDYFKTAAGNPPFGFQERFREGIATSVILRAPTGLGKTDTVLLAWLHWRASAPQEAPRRLVWCLPGRALTEQIAHAAEKRIERLVAAGLLERPIRVYRLLGGSTDNDAKSPPDEEAVLVGTQDLLLSRALNRGYARNPFRWPIDFALLNNDCYWAMDEVQLLGDGLATSLQLAAFRSRFGAFGSAPCCWISATIDPAWVETVDFSGGQLRVIEPDAADRQNPVVAARVLAEKKLEPAPAACRMPQGVADLAAAEHVPGTLTLVIANTVRRAVEIRHALEEKTGAEVRLLHSRFRAGDRRRIVEAALGGLPPVGRIVVATQVIEAGIDVDAALMVTDLAPYASMVQRFGRVNRRGEREGCKIYWVDRPLVTKQKALADVPELSTKDRQKVCAPYEADELAQAEAILSGLKSAAPDALAPLHDSRLPWKHVLRRADLSDLFDTSSDLGGNEIDISRFVRSDPDRDVYVLWRDWEDAATAPPEKPEIGEHELCPVPIGDFSKDLRKAAWAWDSLKGEWRHPEEIYPGMRLLLHASAGKYTPEYGWWPESKAPVSPVPADASDLESDDRDSRSFGYRQSLAAHTEAVCTALTELTGGLSGLGLDTHQTDLGRAALLHDWGKAHPVMQKTLHGKEPPYDELLAKSDGHRTHEVPYFRHELASALAMIASGESDLAAYLAAAHHGRIRMLIRSMPGERARVRGIAVGDRLLACELGGKVYPEMDLSLSLTKLGFGPDGAASWTERVLALRDRLGPFRLAYLEMLLRAADELASARGREATL